MPKESIHKKLARVRPPRVHIEYEVETGGAIEKKQIPFVAGVLADLSFDRDPKTLLPVADRAFVEIDRDNFDKVLANMAPRLVLTDVYDRIANDGSKIPVSITFETMEDFEPHRIAEKVDFLSGLIETRKRLANLRSNLDGNDKLIKLLQKIVEDQDERERLRKHIAELPVTTGKVV